MGGFFLLDHSFNAADAGRAGLVFLDLEVTNYASMFDMRAAADFARDWIIKIANRIDGKLFRIFIPELAVSFERITSVSLVVFIMDHWQVGLNPFINLVFNLLLLFWSKLAVEIKVEAKALSSNVGTLLTNIWIDELLECSKH